MSAVVSFESSVAGLLPLGRHDSLAAASAALPEGAYTTFRTYGGRGVVRLAQHLRRLEDSTALPGRPGRPDGGAGRAGAGRAPGGGGARGARVRPPFAPPRLFLALEPFTPLDPSLYDRGVACITVDLQRDNPHAKDTRF